MLDPERVKLTASTIGFLQSHGQKVDYETIRKALQTSDDGCVNVRRERDTTVNELHVMGGQRMGMEGNQNLLENERQKRQINGYPLRSFSADEPAIILPPKYGGFPQYVTNASERDNFVSRFTEPMSAPLQQNTMLLGTLGYQVTNESASDPYTAYGFEHNLHKSAVAIDYNDMVHRQRKWLKQLSQRARSARGQADEVGIFVSANGDPMTQVEDAAQGAQDTRSFLSMSRNYAGRQNRMQNMQPLQGGGIRNNSISPANYDRQFKTIDDQLTVMNMNMQNNFNANAVAKMANLQQSAFIGTPSKGNGMQSGSLGDISGKTDTGLSPSSPFQAAKEVFSKAVKSSTSNLFKKGSDPAPPPRGSGFSKPNSYNKFTKK